MGPNHQPAASPDEWAAIADREIANLKGAYDGAQSNDYKVLHSQMAVEAILKAIIWKREGWSCWPDNKKPFSYLYQHKLPEMLVNSGLAPDLKRHREIHASWRAVINSVEKQHRYSPSVPSDDEANEVARVARHPDYGVVPWLKQRYLAMISH